MEARESEDREYEAELDVPEYTWEEVADWATHIKALGRDIKEVSDDLRNQDQDSG